MNRVAIVIGLILSSCGEDHRAVPSADNLIDSTATNRPNRSIDTAWSDSLYVRWKGVTIVQEALIITRDDPENQLNSAEHRFPVVSSAPDWTLRRRLEKTLAVESIAPELKDYRKTFHAGSIGRVDVSYHFPFHRGRLLNVVYDFQFIGMSLAYGRRGIVVDLAKGYRLRADDLFRSSRLDELAATLDERLQKEGSPEHTGRVSIDALDDLIIDESGITFLHKTDFPATFEAPSIDPLHLEWSELEEYIEPSGPLADAIVEERK